MTLSTTLLHPESRGRVTLASDYPFDDPVIDPNYLDEEADMERLVEGLKRTERSPMRVLWMGTAAGKSGRKRRSERR